jgi:multidrug efflux pump subunit AcrA (membrane-fusion protein)
LGTIGLALAVISTAGAIFALNPNGAKGQRTADTVANPSSRNPAALVCYGTIDTETGILPLYPVQPSRVVAVPVKEHQTVKKGDVLLQLDDRLAKTRFDQAKADLDAATADLALARKAPEQYQAKTMQQQAAIEAITHDLRSAQHVLARKTELLKDKLINVVEVNVSEELVKKAQAGLRAEEAKMRELKLYDPAVPLAKAEAQVLAKKAQLEQAQLALNETQVVAPVDGQVLQILVGPGSLLAADPRQPALFFAPAGPRIVRTEIEQEFANRLRIDLPVLVQDEYGGSAARPGKVARMADWYTRPRMQMLDPMRLLANEVRTLECIITLEPGQPTFRLGQRVRVTAGKTPGEL